MPTLNQRVYIDYSIQSVIEQDYLDIELLVSDGGSTDGTVELLGRYSEGNQKLFWSSEPDTGPADALNKAFIRARGEIIGWLNSDDLYLPGTIEAVVSAFEANPDWIMCYGHGQHIDESGNIIGLYPTQKPEIGLNGFQSGCFICQPTVFFKTSMLAMIGNLDTSLKTAFDYDFWIRAFKSFPERIGFLDDVLAQSRLHPDCITNKMRATVALEGMALGRKHLGKVNLHWATTFLEELEATTRGNRALFKRQANEFLLRASDYITNKQLEQIKWSIQIVPNA